jgi:hypothetical protein
MKKLILSILIFTHFFLSPPSGAGGAYAQSVTIDPASTASNIIDAKSTNQGITVPKMTAAQKNAILTKTEGMMVYDTDAKQFSYWTGTVWVNFGNATSAGVGWSQSGNDISNTNTGNITVSTAAPNSYSKFEVTNNLASGNGIQGNSTGQYGVGLYGRQFNGGFGVFGEASGTTAIGGYFVGYGASAKALKAEISNGGTAAFFTATGTNGKGLIVNQGNVGIGSLFPVAAKLVVDSEPTIITNAVFGSNGTGISLQKNWPGIGYNSYRDAANNQRYMGTGYGMVTAVDQGNGTYFWNSMGSGSAGDYADELYIAGLNQAGLLDVRSLNVGGNVNALTPLPENSLRANGNVYMPIKTVTGDYTVQDGDYTIDYFGQQSTDVVINLPDPSVSLGRIINIRTIKTIPYGAGNNGSTTTTITSKVIIKQGDYTISELFGSRYYTQGSNIIVSTTQLRTNVTLQCLGSTSNQFYKWVEISDNHYINSFVDNFPN